MLNFIHIISRLLLNLTVDSSRKQKLHERTKEKKNPRSYIKIIFIAIVLLWVNISFGQSVKTGTPNWLGNPFEQPVFIENKGQFGSNTGVQDEIIFQAVTGGVKVYFTKEGLVYHYDECTPYHEEEKDKLGRKEEEKEEEEEEERKVEVKPHSLELKWLNSNSNVQIFAEDKAPFFHTYSPEKNKEQIFASAYKKITYKNLYPNIDVEYIIPEDKGGIKYSLILHPGADLTQVKMKWKGDGISVDAQGNLTIQSSFGDFVDHAPQTFDENGSSVSSSFIVNGETVSFSVPSYDGTKKIIIDPWTSSPTFSTNRAYDVNYDFAGNVYAHGSDVVYQLVKFNSAGALQWVYNSNYTSFNFFGMGWCYGDFAVDANTGTSYISSGFYSGFTPGARIEKVNTNAVQTATYAGNPNMCEIWRMDYNYCNGTIVCGGGSATSPAYQAFVMDTNLVNITPVQVTGPGSATEIDVALLSTDKYSNFCYMLFARALNPAWDNRLFKCPLLSLTPAAWNVPTNHTFQEVGIMYNGGSNGFNGIAVSPNFVYTYDGSIIKKWNKTNGALVSTLNISGTLFQWGGLDVDACDNLYVGVQNTIRVYDVNFNLVNTYNVANTIYDLRISATKIYACGIGFVQQIDLINPNTATVTSTPAACSLCNGTATANVLCGSNTNFQYLWQPGGQTTQTAIGLCPGNYTVTIFANTNCNYVVFTDTVNVNSSSGVVANAGPNFSICTGGNVQLNGSGGGTYSWTPSSSLSNASIANPIATPTVTTTYTLIVTSGVCSDTATTTVTVNSNLTITAAPVSICSGNCSTLTASGASTYTWSPATGLSATTGASVNACPTVTTTYTITGTNAQGCTGTTTVTVTVNLPAVLSSSSTPVLCNGGNTGTATVVATGTPPYTYAWTPSGGNAATATGLSANTYTCTVTDANGCSASAVVTITQPTALTATQSQVNVLCNGQCTGTGTVNASGGTPPYTYAWVPSGGNASVATGLCSASYTCTVTDANGCTFNALFNITQPTAITTSTSWVPATCNQANGSASVTANGGTPAYTYSWAPSGGTNANATGLLAGTYTVTVTDANGCTITDMVVVPTAASTSVTISASTNVNCFGGNNGSATAVVTGGTSPYTYAWTPSGGNAATATGLSANTYTCTVTDANGCSSSTVVTITQPTALTATQSQVNVLCNGQCTGTGTVNASGGTPPYTYAWVPSGGNASVATGLCSASYTCTVTDANGCTFNALFNITQPTVITTSTSWVPATCNQANGSASVNANGGTPAYTYSWAPSGGTNANATGLLAGTYTVTVTDANGCTITDMVVVPNAASLSVTVSASTNVNCFGGNNGSATVVVNGGTPPYSYAWTPSGGNAATATGLSANTYTCTVTDANGCVTSAVVTITQPTALTVTTANTGNVLCDGGNNGSASSTPTGGTSPYTYAWTPSGGNGQNATGLTAGTYTVTVTDANGCSAYDTVTITQPPALSIASTGFAALCNGACNGQVVCIPAGGTQPFSFLWTPGNATGPSVNNLCAGTYTILVTDANGCTITDTANVSQPAPLAATTTVDTSHCNLPDGQACVFPGGGIGAYTYLWTPSGQTGSCATNLTAGQYCVVITDASGCTLSVCATVPSAPGILASISASTNPACFGLCTGTATVTTNAGIGPFNYAWSPSGGNSATATGLCAGTYQVVVTDSNMCSSTVSVTISEPPLLTTSVSVVNTTCNQTNGSATATVSGGTAPYSFSWSNSQTSTAISGLSPGTYSVAITDANGCTASASGVILPSTLADGTFTATADSGCGSVCITVSANQAGLTYNWNFGDNTSSALQTTQHCYDTPGTYNISLTVTDASGCTASTTLLNAVTVWPVPTANFTLNPSQTTLLNATVQFTDQSQGATQWYWNFDDTPNGSSTQQNPSYTYQDTGRYCPILTVANVYGCTDTAQHCLIIKPEFTFYAPNAFTPDGIGDNEYWTPLGVGIDESTYQLYIFDRWGNLIFETKTWGQAWDGRVQNGTSGEIVQQDVYVWKVVFKDIAEHKRHQYIGHVSVIR